MKRKTIILLVPAFCLLMLVSQSHASIFGSFGKNITSVANNIVDGMTETANNMIDTGGDTAASMMALMSKLSDDIGLMADRIGDMADRILDMADKIGEMADRIVETEVIMTNTMVKMQETMVGVSEIAKNGQTGSSQFSVTLDNEFGSVAFYDQAPEIAISEASSEYLLYLSSTLAMNDNSASILIRSDEELQKLWPAAVASLSANDQVYIAVKSIQGNDISSLSNVVLLNLQ